MVNVMNVAKLIAVVLMVLYLLIVLIRRLIPKPPCDNCKYLKVRNGDYRKCIHPEVNSSFYCPPDYCKYHTHFSKDERN